MHPPEDEASAPEPPEPAARLRFELIFASIWLAAGFFVLPAAIYGVGLVLLGPYAENAGMAGFYGDFFGDLVAPSGRTWLLALGPALLAYLVRLVFVGVSVGGGPAPAAIAVQDPPAKRGRGEHARVEPRVSLE